jgi:hypothetical protein
VDNTLLFGLFLVLFAILITVAVLPFLRRRSREPELDYAGEFGPDYGELDASGEDDSRKAMIELEELRRLERLDLRGAGAPDESREPFTLARDDDDFLRAGPVGAGRPLRGEGPELSRFDGGPGLERPSGRLEASTRRLDQPPPRPEPARAERDPDEPIRLPETAIPMDGPRPAPRMDQTGDVARVQPEPSPMVPARGERVPEGVQNRLPGASGSIAGRAADPRLQDARVQFDWKAAAQ